MAHGSPSKERETACRISRIQGLPPESRPGIVRLIRHAWKDRMTSGREGNIRRNHLEVGARPWPPGGWSKRHRLYLRTAREKAQQRVIRPRGTTA